MEKPTTLEISFIQCGSKDTDTHPEEWMLVGLVDDGSEQEEAIAEADSLDRLMCDCCQGYVNKHVDLTNSGEEVLCEECNNEI